MRALARDIERAMRLATIAAATCAAAVTPAQAQGPGVRIDPGAPTAKEYAIPLEEARRQADPSRPPSAPIVQGSRSSPLFGAGIETAAAQAGAGVDDRRRGPAGGRRGTNRGRAGEPADASGRPPRGALTSDPSNPVAQAAAEPGAPPADGGSVALLLGVAGLVLAVGTGGGLFVRRWTRR